MAYDNMCKKCKVEMTLLRDEIVVDTKYKVMKCDKCKHQVARPDN